MIYVFLANGFEETEAIAPIDILRRSELKVVTVGIGEDIVVSSHGIAVVPDITEVDFVPSDDIDMIVLPGGMPGTLNLEKSRTVQDAIGFCIENDKYIAAICAAPSILGRKGLFNGRKPPASPALNSSSQVQNTHPKALCRTERLLPQRAQALQLISVLSFPKFLQAKRTQRKSELPYSADE